MSDSVREWEVEIVIQSKGYWELLISVCTFHPGIKSGMLRDITLWQLQNHVTYRVGFSAFSSLIEHFKNDKTNKTRGKDKRSKKNIHSILASPLPPSKRGAQIMHVHSIWININDGRGDKYK